MCQFGRELASVFGTGEELDATHLFAFLNERANRSFFVIHGLPEKVALAVDVVLFRRIGDGMELAARQYRIVV